MATTVISGSTVSSTVLPGTADGDSITIGTSTVTGPYNAQGGDDLISISDSSISGNYAAGAGNDTLAATSSTMTSGLDMGTDNDAVSLTSVSGLTTLQLGAGDDTLEMTDSSMSGAFSDTGGVTSNVDLTGSTIGGAMTFTNTGGATVDVLDGSSVGGVINLGSGGDSLNISGSTVLQLAGGAGVDTIVIEGSTLTSTGNAVNLDGDQVTISDTEMSGNVNLGSGSSTISMENSSANAFVDQGANSAQITITGSTVGFMAIDASSSTADFKSVSISDSSIGQINTSSASNDTVIISGGTTLTAGVALNGGNDALFLSTDTTFEGTASSVLFGGSQTATSIGDTLNIVGTGAFSISLNGAATLEDGSTTTLLTNGNYSLVDTPFNGSYDGTLSLAESGTTVRISSWEHLEAVPCFVAGTMIATNRGERPVESLSVGDRVHTADAGLQAIRWINSSRISLLDVVIKPDLLPIRIKQGALGGGMPHHDLLVSPQHRMLVSGKLVERMFGETQVLVAAKHLLEMDGIEIARDIMEIEYFHIMLSDHHVIYAEGAPAETLYVGAMALRAMDEGQQKELETIFPELALPVCERVMQPARQFIGGRQGRKLVERMRKNGHPLLDGTVEVPAYCAAQ